MTKIKSREYNCPDSLMDALVDLEVARLRLEELAHDLRAQAGLFSSDVVSTLLHDTADTIEDNILSADTLKIELCAFVSK